MSARVLGLAARLADRGEAYVLATVVWRRGPSSGRQGSKAVITADGTVHGWLGGACAEPTVVQEARGALEDGRSRLMFLGPADELDGRWREGITSVPMACESEGALEVYLEPMLPVPSVVIVGSSPAVDTLARLADALGWSVTIVDDGARGADHPEGIEVVTDLELDRLGIGPRTFVVVATQGHYDEPALQQALATEAGYVGLVASARRAESVREWLHDRGVPDEALARVHAPAGVDLGSIEHEEMAVAILAELVQHKASGALASGFSAPAPAEAIDPICEMTVDAATARWKTEFRGISYFFCAPGCQKAFEADPEKFAGGLRQG